MIDIEVIDGSSDETERPDEDLTVLIKGVLVDGALGVTLHLC